MPAWTGYSHCLRQKWAHKSCSQDSLMQRGKPLEVVRTVHRTCPEGSDERLGQEALARMLLQLIVRRSGDLTEERASYIWITSGVTTVDVAFKKSSDERVLETSTSKCRGIRDYKEL